MANNCNDINPLQHSGTSQLQRVLAALSPQSAPIDGRSYGDLILFAKEYARYLQYYDILNAKSGDWQALMQMDVAVILATLANEQMPLYETYRTGIYTAVFNVDINDAAHQAQNEALCKQLLEAVFDILFTYIYHLDAQYKLLPADSDEKKFLFNIIAGKLRDAYLRLLAYYQEVRTAGIVDDSIVYIPPELIAPTTIQSAKIWLAQPLGSDWQGPLPVVPALSGSSIIGQVKNLVTHNLFNAITDTILKSIGAIAGYSDGQLQNVLTNFPTHSPHYALFLAFIRLFRHAQDELNRLTEKHLKFYDQQVLQLRNNGAQGDQAHLIIELQKNTDNLLVPGGTAFKAGKDADGKEIFYTAEHDFTINKTSVKALKSILVQADSDAAKGDYQTVYASPVADSGDGAGAAISSNDQSWFPFGNPKTTKNLGDAGFAIASQQLYLQEGKRTITILFVLQQNISLTGALLQNAFQVKITGEKKWIAIDPSALTAKVAGNKLSFVIALDAKAPAIVGYNAKIHPGLFNTALPVVQFILNSSKNNFNPLLALSRLTVSSIMVSVEVKGIKKLQVSTDTGAVDPSKPFMPFTAAPHIGSSFLLGSREIFQKPLSSMDVMIQWDKLPPEGLDIYEKKNDIIYNGFQLQDAIGADKNAGEDINKYFGERVTYKIGGVTKDIYFRKHSVITSWLQNGIWVAESLHRGLFSGKALFYSGDFRSSWVRPPLKYAQTVNLLGTDAWQNNYDFISCPHAKYQPAQFDSQADEKFSINTTDGFLKFELSGDDFAHDAYLKQILNVSITTSGSTQTVNNRPDPPYTPVIKSIEVNYSSSGQVDISGNSAQSAFYFLYPFGLQQQAGSFNMLPAFPNEGELYIGLEGTRAPENVSLLFQVSEGSANPLKQQQPVIWSYLSTADQWEAFDQYSIEDHTNGLLQSGLIIFSLQEDTATAATLMGGSLAWLRATVVQDADAICKIIAIQAQGLAVSFADINNTGNYYKAPVPANTISKLVVSDPLIKKISQPYSSFGGRKTERDPDFYVRVSERLRHKQRAISIWDYEHIVLQQFPEIYKAKCLNHTGLQPAQGSRPAALNEAWPGHVTVVTVPDLQNSNAVDPLLPYTSLGTLTAIQQYLQTLISPFVQLTVLNPQFEEVQFDFKVRFLPGYDVKVFGDKLNGAIEQFLSPWAFGGGTDIEFGGKISKSAVLKFIEDQYYVDYVSCFKMNHWTDIAGGIVKYNVEEAIATTSRSILVSYHNPDTGDKHTILPILTETATCDCT